MDNDYIKIMEYKLSQIHFDRIRNYDKSLITKIFDSHLIIDVLDYIKYNNDVRFLFNHNKFDILEIFSHFDLTEYYILKILISDDFIETNGDNLSSDFIIEKIMEYNQIFHQDLDMSNKFFDFVNLNKYQKETLNNVKMLYLLIFIH
tara:strand:- start:286 stop:726 length:441 start_codon:yes stop_codon:yes gene_type:complete